MRTRVFFAILLLPAFVYGQHGSSTVVNPYTGPQDAAAGARLYRSQCAGCHGFDGNGTGAGPGLTSGAFRHGASDEAIFHSINKGVPGTSMPAFNYTGRQIWQLVTHVRSLAITHGTAHVGGDAEAGILVFKARCSGCHTVAAEGGLVGPDLTSVGSKLNPTELRQAILEPDAAVANSFWSVKLTTSSETIEGTRLNEDTFSIQIRDRNGRLRSIRKSDVKATELVRDSPMPKLSQILAAGELENLVAYLSRQKGQKQ